MIYLMYVFFALCSFTINILSWILAVPLGILSVILGRNTLPYPLSLFHTHDNDLDGGYDLQPPWPKKTGIGLAMQRAKWIIRNPGYGFDAYWFGIPRGPETQVIRTFVQGTGSDDPTTYFRINHTLTYKGRKYFSYRGKHFWFGWNPDGPSKDRHMLKFSIRNLFSKKRY